MRVQKENDEASTNPTSVLSNPPLDDLTVVVPVTAVSSSDVDLRPIVSPHEFVDDSSAVSRL